MSAPYVEQTSAKRMYHYLLTGGNPMMDEQGRRFQPHGLTITIHEDRMYVGVTGTDVKANGEIGEAQRHLSWYATGGDALNTRPMPAWIANLVARRLRGGHIAGPPMPSAWAAVLLPSETDS